MIDSHLHVVDFLQQQVTTEELSAVLRGVQGAVVFGLPVKKKWAMSEPQRPTYYLDDNAPCGGYSMTDELVVSTVRALPAAAQDRVAPLICGFDPTDRLAADHVELMISRFDGWRGVGEVLLRHDDLTELTYGENARASHPALDDVLDICEAWGWPFTFHQDASSAGRSGGWEYLEEVTAMLADHPAVTMVWSHGGVSRRVRPDDHVEALAGLLDRHPNLHLDLSWVLFDAVVDGDEPDPRWVTLISRNPDRFVLGSDVFGDVSDQPSMLGRWAALTRRLPTSARRQVETDNALRLWWD